ncbi:hypothetical protein J6590_071982 [Homalodisca vitripennis]|nr:hypothetical protein J6590_071982 [Homalodisca vitripennis]
MNIIPTRRQWTGMTKLPPPHQHKGCFTWQPRAPCTAVLKNSTGPGLGDYRSYRTGRGMRSIPALESVMRYEIEGIHQFTSPQTHQGQHPSPHHTIAATGTLLHQYRPSLTPPPWGRAVWEDSNSDLCTPLPTPTTPPPLDSPTRNCRLLKNRAAIKTSRHTITGMGAARAGGRRYLRSPPSHHQHNTTLPWAHSIMVPGTNNGLSDSVTKPDRVQKVPDGKRWPRPGTGAGVADTGRMSSSQDGRRDRYSTAVVAAATHVRVPDSSQTNS